ncbi:MAG: class I SAM-dependent methyltransferase, partial [Myxococcota bacterium]|nr:class I SAM-dependent methyltransferase [Myxococcota bacterium]
MTPSSTENKDIQEVGDFFNAYAEKFSSIYEEDDQKRGWFDSLMDRWFRQAIYTRFKFTLEQTAKSSIQSVLDIGCGPGHYSVAFLEQGKTVTAIDLAQDMLRLTQSRVDATGHGERFTSLHGDYMSLELEEQADAACVMGVFDYVADP